MNHNDIEKAASQIITTKIEHGEIVKMKWAVQELISSMGEIMGDGTDFHLIAADYYAWRVIKKVVNKLDAATNAAKSNQQMDLEGFASMQEAYTVKRDGAIALVPVELMTVEERENRACLFDSFADALKQHAKELRAYNENVQTIEVIAETVT
jgi:hypothetical protein